ncbi:MAG: alpha/beta hydrolase [Spirochaetaceae bacterium]|nr:MAG: alpha/beta hydrolase [Spirochaetaceae bacterium]
MEALRDVVRVEEPGSASMSGAGRLASLEPKRVSVPGGSVMVLVSRGTNPDARPVVFVPGWGKRAEGFADTFAALDPGVTLYYFESREKTSSDVAADADFSMQTHAYDLARCVDALGLRARSWIGAGSCFGAAVLMEALALATIEPEVAVCYDPMPRLWVPQWIIRSIVPWIPIGFVAAIRPAVRNLLLHGMKQPTQRALSRAVIDDAVLWKWRLASVQANDWSAFDTGPRIAHPVHVVNGTTDRFHDASVYPRIAASVPDSIFLHVPVEESQRNRLIGRVICAYALERRIDTVPESLASYVRCTRARSEAVGGTP